MRVIWIAIVTALGTPLLAGEGQTFASGPAQVTLLELFTSEGCSSCPPAERWMAERRTDGGLWRDFVPVSWHVDYWNRLGWPDKFSTREFTQRQHAYSEFWRSANVYTPCFVRDGREWRSQEGRTKATKRAAGALSVRYDGRTVRAEFAGPSATAEPFELHAAVLGQSRPIAGRTSVFSGRGFEESGGYFRRRSM